MAKPKKRPSSSTISNRRARFDYAVGDSLLVGIELTGAEVKSLRMGQGQLTGAYVNIKDNELWLINAMISGTKVAPIEETNQTRTRKLLARKSEINKLIQAKQEGLTIIPLDILTSGRYIKVRISSAKGKKHYDKRNTIKARDQERKIRGYDHVGR